ncbi:helix-turn-helix domain-containing protein [Clostridium botulinum]|uniref:helix-turn-helix domain-containing protein n=1 Tax=unclassified Clostridium TaxID=2614128 RepID=UPI0013CDD70F|nr:MULTISPECIES: helix-turn-helix transcriptional regulator [unclassified Clostridium]MBY7008481.1 helix-turn-helix domain-containing protein [Clostridium botulinum]NFH73117.1 helix-turn-helix domain-containing protein [Clostridium botulinum]NFI81894.1 helix-turn-helix domain-containing protein [Clostridium botulinum]NFJ72303.1 helix-turn-helix domain-containing protein [Clostridium botulinum]NFK65404.1 helix-turn-helix domain-containing protein [Clostridium botulinum]
MRELRERKGIKSTFVAKKLHISRDRLKRIEGLEVTLPVEFLPDLCEMYGVSYNELIDRRVEAWKKSKKS